MEKKKELKEELKRVKLEFIARRFFEGESPTINKTIYRNFGIFGTSSNNCNKFLDGCFLFPSESKSK